MQHRPGPDRTRRNLLKAAAIVAGGIAAYGRLARGQSYYYGSEGAPSLDAAPFDKPPWSGGPGCNPNGNCPGNRPCFLRGTRILTDRGYRPIEMLAAGDRVAARFAGLAAIGRMDSFTLCRSGPRREWLGPSRPVRLKRGALGDGMPSADLCLTASHAVFVDGYLVPVGDLVNGASIVFEAAEGRATLDFFHIELARHDVLDAAGAPCESLRHPADQPCAPLLGFHGRRSELNSRLRSAAALLVDRRQPIDLIRDALETRGELWAVIAAKCAGERSGSLAMQSPVPCGASTPSPHFD